MLSFPNGLKVTVTGFRGKRYTLTPNRYEVLLFKAGMSAAGEVVTAEFGYRGNVWTMNRYGKVFRVANGKFVTLCDLASVVTKVEMPK